MSELKKWAVVEKGFIQEDIKWLKAGAKLISPSGDNITTAKLEQLAQRLEHVKKVLREENDADTR